MGAMEQSMVGEYFAAYPYRRKSFFALLLRSAQSFHTQVLSGQQHLDIKTLQVGLVWGHHFDPRLELPGRFNVANVW